MLPPADPHISPHHPGHSPLLSLLCRPGRSGKERELLGPRRGGAVSVKTEAEVN